ncbi:hypothetical protein [Paenibacillus contaminans]|uniref:ABC transporter substrate-binding protein n=1 Tax=Paenibacillus contaminans TaxID=450362 RepID=A0A329MNU8_9BACL|nr:hypothetical protein [Paenibacillus contaminans]MDF2724797.1 extracellular solute-binding protein family 1 [Paenibacillus sp.]RAV19587.1 hypothetical protein DQG23_19165 [Paenibacillus contaminans]
MGRGRKYGAAGMAAAMVAAVALSACSKDGGETKSPDSSGSPAPAASASPKAAANKFEKKVTLTYLNMIDMSKWKDGTPVEKVFEEKFNVDLKALPINPWDAEKLKVTLAGGTIPDVLITWDAQGKYRDGIIRKISMDMVKEHMPNVMKIIEQYDDKTAWAISKDYKTGDLIQVPVGGASGLSNTSVFARKDWLDKVGITKLPETLDELHDMFKKFTFDDPDGNGKNDTYGVSEIFQDTNFFSYGFNNIYAAYGVNPEQWGKAADNKIVYGAVSDRYKQALKLLNAWFKEGIIDPASVSDKKPERQAKILDNKVGAIFSNANYMNEISKDPMFLLSQKNPAAVPVQLPNIIGPEGFGGGTGFGEWVGWGMMFGAKATDEQVIRAMQMTDAMYADEARSLAVMAKFGIEGQTYEKKDGAAVIKQGVDAAEQGAGIFIYPLYFGAFSELVNGTAVDKAIEENRKKVPRINHVVDAKQVDFIATQNKAIQQAEMKKIAQEFQVKAISGAIDIDKSWDEYVERWNKAGGKQLTEEVNKLPIIHENKKLK